MLIGPNQHRPCDAETALLAPRLEFELHVFRPGPSGPEPVHAGWDLLGEQTADVAAPVLELLRDGLDRLGLAPRTLEVELGPGQLELTFPAGPGPEIADRAVLIRSAVKQLAARNGMTATFMCRPKVGDSFPSGWHLHQSLVRPDDLSQVKRAFDLNGWVGVLYSRSIVTSADDSAASTSPTWSGRRWSRVRSPASSRCSSPVHRPPSDPSDRCGSPIRAPA